LATTPLLDADVVTRIVLLLPPRARARARAR
jgi:hypothetical protein